MNSKQSYWNERFAAEGTIWGVDACLAAKRSVEVFKKENVSKILVPGCAYGRNSSFLARKGFDVVAVDISDEAIHIAKKELNNNYCVKYIQGDVLEQQLTNEFDGIISINFLHLFDDKTTERILIKFSEFLRPKGLLVLTSMSIHDSDFGKGSMINKYTFESKKGRPIHYFDQQTMKTLINKYFTPLTIEEIIEHENHGGKKHHHNMVYVVAQKLI